MKSLSLFLVLVALFVPVALEAVINPSREPWLKSGETLVCFGDSITAGDYYFKHLKESLESRGIRVVNAGKSGDKTPTAFTRLTTVTNCNPDAVMFFFGANDSAVGRGRWRDEPTVEPVTYRDNLLWMIQYLRLYSNVRKFSIVPPTGQLEGEQFEEFGDIRTAYCQAAREAADRANAIFVPLDVVFENVRRTMPKDGKGLQLTRDGVHLSPSGSRLAAETMLRAWNMDGARAE